MIPTPRSRRQRILACLPDADDALRRLADAIQAPEACRKRVCRAAHRCQGGFGPPCFLADRGRFADAVREEMDEHRASPGRPPRPNWRPICVRWKGHAPRPARP